MLGEVLVVSAWGVFDPAKLVKELGKEEDITPRIPAVERLHASHPHDQLNEVDGSSGHKGVSKQLYIANSAPLS